MQLDTFIGFFQEGHGAAGGMGSPDSFISAAVIPNYNFFASKCSLLLYIDHNYLPYKGCARVD